MNDATGPIVSQYKAALAGHLAAPDERWLHQAYELGRSTLNHNFRLLDLVLLHHRALAEMLSERPDGLGQDWTDPATLFLTECLSCFEMTFKGYHEIKGRLAGVDGALAVAKQEIQATQAALTAEVAERQRAEMLRQAQRLRIIEQISGGIAHHFNNMLTVVIGNLHLAQRQAKGNARLTSILDTAMRGAERGAVATGQLLACSRRQMLRPERVNPRTHLARTAALMRSALHDACEIETAFPIDLWPVDVDSTELDLALINLGMNARDAMGGTGTMRLAASNQTVSDAGLGLDGDYVAIEVNDTGSGIAAADLPHVFEPFFTTKGPGSTGLGLSQVDGFVRQSGGAVEIRSHAAVGTSVRLYLPAAPRIAEPEVPVAARDMRGAANYTVLVVDDDADVVGLAAMLIEDLGFKVRVAYRAASALGILKRGEKIDLLFADIGLPGGMGGIALAEEARGVRPALPVLLTTGYSEVVGTNWAAARGLAVVGKPYKAAALGQIMLSLIEGV